MQALDSNNMDMTLTILFSIVYIIMGSYFIYGSYNRLPKTLQQCYTLILPDQPKWIVALSIIVLFKGIYDILTLFIKTA